MKTIYSILLSASMVIALLFVEVVSAGTYKTVNCGCDPTAEDDKICSCSTDTSLAPFPGGTKEFRATCTNANQSINYSICIGDKSSRTTCTIPAFVNFLPGDAYVSRSCTNWSMKRDQITVRTVCFGDGSNFDKNNLCKSS